MDFPGWANIQAYPTPEMWVGNPGSITVLENNETQSVALTEAVYFAPVVDGGTWTENSETSSVALGAASYAPAPIVPFTFTENTETQNVSLS